MNKNITLYKCTNCNGKHTMVQDGKNTYIFSYDSLMIQIENGITKVSKRIATYSNTSFRHFKCEMGISFKEFEKDTNSYTKTYIVDLI